MSFSMARVSRYGLPGFAGLEPVAEEAFDAPLTTREFLLGLCGLDDDTAPDRIGWIAEWAQTTDLPAPGILTVAPQRLAAAECQGLIFHGSDADRVCRLVADSRWAGADAGADKVIIAVTDDAGPDERAALLVAGADDVFDLTTPSAEAAARTRAHLRRRFRRPATED